MKGIRTRRGRLVLAFVVASVAAVSVLSVTAASASRRSNITLTIDVFGDFGYHDLYKQYEAAHRERQVGNLKKKAAELGYELNEKGAVATQG